jgi:hypothetical protein
MNATTTRRAVLAGAASLPVFAMPALTTAAETDPVFAAIERCRIAETANLLEPSPPAADDQDPAREALARTVPTTPTGLAALITFVREQTAALEEFYFCDADNFDERLNGEQFAFLSSLNKAVRGMAGLKPWGGVAVAEGIDPIFAAIEQHRMVNQTFNEVLHRKSDLELQHHDLQRKEFPGIALGEGFNHEIAPGVSIPICIRTQKDVADIMRIVATDSNPRKPRAEIKKMEADLRTRLRKETADYKAARSAAGLDEMDRAEGEHCSLETEASDAMLSCRPTTRQGLAAFLAYVVKFQKRRGDPDEMQLALQTAAAAANALG